MKQEAMNQIIKESADAEGDREHGYDPSAVGGGRRQGGPSSRETCELADTWKRGSQRQLNRGITDARHAHRENHCRIGAYHLACTLSCGTPVLVKVESDEPALHVNQEPDECSGV